MSQPEKENIIKYYETLPEEKLIHALLQDPADYEDRVYEIAQYVCKKRGLNKKLQEEKNLLKGQQNTKDPKELADIQCFHCKAENSSTTYFCLYCGEQLLKEEKLEPYSNNHPETNFGKKSLFVLIGYWISLGPMVIFTIIAFFEKNNFYENGSIKTEAFIFVPLAILCAIILFKRTKEYFSKEKYKKYD